MEWEVMALRYATHERRAAQNFLNSADIHDGPMPMDYFIWVLRSGPRTIVVDTGFALETGVRRGRRTVLPIADGLSRLGIDPAAVEDVVLTHLHYDHAGNLDLFPAATFHLQEREMAFATGRHMCCRCLRDTFEVEDVVAMVRALYAGRVAFHSGDAEIADGVTVHHVGGHTDGLQMVRVATRRGPVVLASDAAHYYDNMERGNPYPILFHVGDMVDGWRRALQLAGDPCRIVPGHDPKVRQVYPQVQGGGGDIVALHEQPIAADRRA